MEFKIYLVINLKNGKVYVGQTKRSIKERWSQHVNVSKYENYAISKAIRKYGENSFLVQQIAETDTKESVDNLEQLYIILFRSKNSDFGYNQTSGGEGFLSHHSEESKQAIATALAGNQYRTGIPHDQESKDKISAGLKKAFREGRRKKSGGIKKGTILGPMPEEGKKSRSEGAKRYFEANPDFLKERGKKIAEGRFIKTVAWG